MADIEKIRKLARHLKIVNGGSSDEHERRKQQAEDQPRDEQGRFIAVDPSYEHAKAQPVDPNEINPDTEDYGQEDALSDEDVARLLSELTKSSDPAKDIQIQALQQIALHKYKPEKLDKIPSEVELYSAYKNNPHGKRAYLLKYLIHRIENQSQYNTPEGAMQADNDFSNRAQQALALSRVDNEQIAKLSPIQEMHHYVAKNPNLIRGLLTRQSDLHRHLKEKQAKAPSALAQHRTLQDIGGEPHVALFRGLTRGERKPDPLTCSYADTKQALGGRCEVHHSHWVPLKNVWYSYDHGPHEAHPQKYYPAQDEFVVSPHELKNAYAHEVNKVVKPKPPKRKVEKLAASWTPSYSVLSKNYPTVTKPHREDPWDAAKYARGGEAEYAAYLKNPIHDPTDEESLRKALPVSHKKKAEVLEVAKQIGDRAPSNKIEFSQPMTLAKLYRAYKNTPHRPEALLLKYMVHRLENVDKYKDHNNGAKLDKEFLDLHKKGEASTKNSHISIHDLHSAVANNASAMQSLVNHRAKLHDFIKTHLPEHIIDVNGEPHLGLTRGLNVGKELRGSDHALASYAHRPFTGFGSKMHHQLVPLKNLWYSYDLGPASTSSEQYGAEDELLVSPHDVRYSSDSESEEDLGNSETTINFPRNLHGMKVEGNEADIVKAKLANPRFDPNAHPELATFDSVFVRLALARHPKINVDLQRKLAMSSNESVTEALAENDKLDPSLYQGMVNRASRGSSVKSWIARKPNLSVDIQKQLVSPEHNSEGTRLSLASNEHLHPVFHEQLANDSSDLVRTRMASNPKLLPSLHAKLASDRFNRVRIGLAGNDSITPEAQAKILEGDDDLSHDSLAKNPNVTLESQKRLAFHKESDVRRRLAGNLNVHESLHSHLVKDSDEYVRGAMAGNKNLSPVHHEMIASDRSYITRRHLASHPNVSPEIQARLARDVEPSVRAAVASNLNVHPSLHEKLANDEDIWVKSNMKSNPVYKPKAPKKLAASEKSQHETLAKQTRYPSVASVLNKFYSLKKAFHPKLWNVMAMGHNPRGADTVDFDKQAKLMAPISPDYKAAAEHAANIPETQWPDFDSGGVSPKMVHREKEGSQIYMTKPYHRAPEHWDAHRTKHDAMGWAVGANRALYDASGIGHLCEQVQSYTHKGVPSTVHPFEKGYTEAGKTPVVSKMKALPKELHLPYQQIGIMDFLTHNADRHTYNIMLNEHKQPLAIDHERSFQYIDDSIGSPHNTMSRVLANVLGGRHDKSYDIYGNVNIHLDEMDTVPLAHWWNANKDKIQKAFASHLDCIKNEDVKKHIGESFSQRFGVISDWAKHDQSPEIFRGQSGNPYMLTMPPPPPPRKSSGDGESDYPHADALYQIARSEGKDLNEVQGTWEPAYIAKKKRAPVAAKQRKMKASPLLNKKPKPAVDKVKKKK